MSRSKQNRAALWALFLVPLWINLVSPGTLQAGVGKTLSVIDARLRDLGILTSSGTFAGMVNGSFTELDFAGGAKIVEYTDATDAIFTRSDDGLAVRNRIGSAPASVSASDIRLLQGVNETKLTTLNGALTSANGTAFKITAPATQQLQLGSGGNDALWLLTTGGHWLPGTSFDNSFDLGSSSYRLRNGYFGTSIQTPQVALGSGGPTLTPSGSTTVVSGSLDVGDGTIVASDTNGLRFDGDSTTGIVRYSTTGIAFKVGNSDRLALTASFFGSDLGIPVYGFKRLVGAVPLGSTLNATYENFVVRTNEGASSLTTFTLPTASSGLTYTFVVQDSDGIRVDAASGDTIQVAATVTAADGYVENTTVGSTLTLVAINATEWVAIASHGTWTAGP